MLSVCDDTVNRQVLENGPYKSLMLTLRKYYDKRA